MDFRSEKIDVVYNGVPIEALRRGGETRAKIRETLGLKSDDVAVLFAGSGWERKGLRFAIEAIEKSRKEMRLLVAGRGDERKFGSARVQFLGVVQDMPALYGAADIFLLPTIYDPFSNACLEALAAGLPVITTRANGFSEIMETGVHGTVLDDPQNADAICEALLFWSDSARREQAGIGIRELADRFDISANVSRTLQILTLYRRLVPPGRNWLTAFPLRIGQRFNAGIQRQKERIPSGTKEQPHQRLINLCRTVLSSLKDSIHFGRGFRSVETLGYCHQSPSKPT